MKAARYHSPGGPDVLTYESVETPKLDRGEVLLKVAGCSVNRLDVWARSGRYQTRLPHAPGTDIAGEVVSCGPGTKVAPGLKAVVYPVISDGTCAYCRRGDRNLCVARGFVGIATEGGYAEQVVVPEANLIPADGIDPEAAAAIPVDFGTAWRGLSSLARAGKDDTVLVWGAAGGLGHAAVQIAKLVGAKVIAVVGNDEKADFVRSLGADLVINHRSQNVVEETRSFTDGIGASVVFDHVGGDTWGVSLASLARGGRMLTLGLTSGAKFEVEVRHIYTDELKIMGVYGQFVADIKEVLRLTREGKLMPKIHEVIPLESARRAHELIESREVRGKIVLVP
ncbi:MAG: zinc-binding dehydrogenase [Nitrososphaerota archaeon]|nr:zinc-binding dehydrogenase [Nitrososphaerota archaeon]MDG6942650.1 zinc-binding dehydrogenase [Nitrososphaerota archaeon]MDG6950363.1 zinc-binding dehydrogenase [Nitrososphaerota archaeon]